jgi:hypothetical protein
VGVFGHKQERRSLGLRLERSFWNCGEETKVPRFARDDNPFSDDLSLTDDCENTNGADWKACAAAFTLYIYCIKLRRVKLSRLPHLFFQANQ